MNDRKDERAGETPDQTRRPAVEDVVAPPAVFPQAYPLTATDSEGERVLVIGWARYPDGDSREVYPVYVPMGDPCELPGFVSEEGLARYSIPTLDVDTSD